MSNMQTIRRILDGKAPLFEPESTGFTRAISHRDVQFVQKIILDAFSVEPAYEEVINVANLILWVEHTMIGRIAGNIQNYVLNYLVRYYATKQLASSHPRPAHAEIGVLFGGSLLLTQIAIQQAEARVANIGVDPLDGYYMNQTRQKVDKSTSLPVDSETVEQNVQRLDLTRDTIHLFCSASTDTDTIRRVGEYDLLSLFIDGDHSYEGVKHDWEKYAPFVVDGGFVLFDNYHDPVWPQITEFVDSELLSQTGEWAVQSSFDRSILLRRTEEGGIRNPVWAMTSTEIIARENQIRSLAKELYIKKEELRRETEKNAKAGHMIARLDESLKNTRQVLSECEKELFRLKEANSNLRNQLMQSKKRLAQRENQLAQSEEQIELMHNSESWKIGNTIVMTGKRALRWLPRTFRR